MEKVFRAARTVPEKIAALEDMLAITPKHKGTDHLRADLRRKMAKLVQTGDKKAATQRASMVIQKEGAAQVLVIGLPNAGKSQLVSAITKASTTVADYPFTTSTAIPGMVEFENIQIQLIDMPPLLSLSSLPWFSAALIRADALLIMVDLSDDPLAQMDTVIAELGNARIAVTDNQIADEEYQTLRHKKALIAANKIDMPGADWAYQALEEEYKGRLPATAISAQKGTGLEELKRNLFESLSIIRVYTRAPGGKPDFDDPIILEKGSTLEDAAEQVHKDFRAGLKYARVWGSGKHDGIMIKRDHILQDGDIIELHV
jgi:ribosome-interacting GTPase 1